VKEFGMILKLTIRTHQKSMLNNLDFNDTKSRQTIAHRTAVGKAKHEPFTEHFTNKKVTQNKFGVLGI
jgi:hypothetical protein